MANFQTLAIVQDMQAGINQFIPRFSNTPGIIYYDICILYITVLDVSEWFSTHIFIFNKL